MTTETSFGGWVRRRRRALDLLQKDLAHCVGCSVAALQKIERDERRPSRQLAGRLATCLDVRPEERELFLQIARGERLVERLAPAGESLPEPPGTRVRASLPARPTLLVGREQELAAIAGLLHTQHCRLLTLTGPGGIGKTHLATAIARQHRAAFAHGAAFVPLEPLADREQVVTAIADSLGLVLYSASDRAEQLMAALREQALLLVLDNFEHLLTAPGCASLVGDLVRDAPEVMVLVTSREPLRLQAEWVFTVQGLPVPESGDLEALEASSAAQLFLARARQVGADVALADVDREAVRQICQVVEGLPLALELAAAWVPTLPLEEIAREIGRNVDFLAAHTRDVPDRHQSIRAAFTHSWRLLTPMEQDALRRVAIFRGGFGREAAEEVAGAALPVLASLVTKSLLRQASGRYELHELLRQYASEQLQANQQAAQETADRHAAYYALLLERRGPDLRGPRQPEAIADLLRELGNIRAAWTWSVRHLRAEQLVRSADTLFWLYEARSNCREGVPLFGEVVEALQRARVSGAPETARSSRALLALGQALSYQGYFCLRQGRHQLARDVLQQAHALLASLGGEEAQEAQSTAAAFLGTAYYANGAYEEGRRLLSESLAEKQAQGDRWAAAFCLRQLGLLASYTGDHHEARRLLGESLALSRQMGNPWSIASSLNLIGATAHAQGDERAASQLLHEALTLSQALDDRFNVASALRGLGQVSWALGQPDEARRYLTESVRLWREINDQESLARTLNHFGELLLAAGDRSGARQYFLEALTLAEAAQIAPIMLEALLGLAALHALEGAAQPALELLIPILQHPASPEEVRLRAERLRGELAAHLTTSELQAVADRSRDVSLEALIHGMGFGALFLLGIAGGLAGLYSLRPTLITTAGIKERVTRLTAGTWAMALAAWGTVITGTWIVHRWYRAKPPEGAAGRC